MEKKKCLKFVTSKKQWLADKEGVIATAKKKANGRYLNLNIVSEKGGGLAYIAIEEDKKVK